MTAIDLFSGCGGLTSGLRAAGFNVVAAIEKDADAATTYRANHPNVKLHEGDIREVSPIDLLRDLGLSVGEVDLVAGCPPCQGFTRLTEKSRRDDPRNSLVRTFLAFVVAIRPRACMLENVPGLLTRGKELFDELLTELIHSGYHIEYDVVELADYGVPQFRKRLVLLATLDGEIAIPQPTHQNPLDTVGPRRSHWRTVRDAIGRLPVPPLRSRVLAGKERPKYPWHVARDISPIVTQRLKHALKTGAGHASLPDALRLACHKRLEKKNPGCPGYFDVYGAMQWDQPSPAITSGCTNASKGRFGHPGTPRPVTAREAAALQTFPLSYQFRGGLESVAAQIGNALPRRFAKVMGRAVAHRLREIRLGLSPQVGEARGPG